MVNSDPLRLVAWSAAVLTLASAVTRQFSVARSFISWFAPLLFPLLLIHTVLNPTFSVSSRLWGVLPFREEGMLHALVSGSKIMCLMIAAVLWRYVDAPRLFDWLIVLKCPVSLLVMFGQSHGILIHLRRRAENVLLAQQARGIAAGPSLLAKVRALPSVILPVALSTLDEADVRAAVLASRGFGTGLMTVLSQPGPSSPEIAIGVISGLGWALLQLL